MELETIRQYTSHIPTNAEGGTMPVHMHAEIRMVLHYEMAYQGQTWPQAIKTSEKVLLLSNCQIAMRALLLRKYGLNLQCNMRLVVGSQGGWRSQCLA